MLAAWRARYERLLEWIVIALMVALAVEVTLGVAFRYLGYALVWYDEVASIGLAWVTYYGAALAALKRSHIGVPELLELVPRTPRVLAVAFSEACVLAFFALLAWVGYAVLEVLAGDSLVSLPGVSVAYAQSVIPIGAVLFIVAELLVIPAKVREALRA